MSEMKVATFMERDGWGSGPWDCEPDRMEWRDGEFVCLMLRNRGGAWCGYIGVQPGHPWHGKHYHSCWDCEGVCEHGIDADVHGGLTYADACMEGDDHDQLICHVPSPGEPDNLWWLGFDCSHLRDYSPAYVARGREVGIEPFRDEVYRAVEYVRSEVAGLVAQAREARR